MNDMQAFPRAAYLDYNGREPGTHVPANEGMTLRDYFAAKALPYVLSEWGENGLVAKACYRVADEMLKEREERGGK